MNLDNYLTEKYGMSPAIASLAMLLDCSSIPQFKDDPTRAGMVILDTEWVKQNIVYEWFPLIGQCHCHRAMASALFEALAEIANSPFHDYIDPRQCGIFVPRRASWKLGNPLSAHAFGLAIDINWDDNPYGVRGGVLVTRHPWIIECFKRHGFEYGGDWRHPDEMHFQFLYSTIKLPR